MNSEPVDRIGIRTNSRAVWTDLWPLRPRYQGDYQMSGSSDYPYVTNLNVLFPALDVIDVQALADACTDRWYNQTLCTVNDAVVRLGVMQGEYHWHKHDNDDEFFFTLDGELKIELEDRTIELGPRQGCVIPKGVLHRPRAERRSVILMVETSAIVPTGDEH